MATFPSKVNYATGDILTATNMNDVGGAINLLQSAQFSAGKNAVINGDFGIWQRGTSINLTSAASAYTADRFKNAVTFSAGTCTVSRQAFTPGTAPASGYEGTYFHRTTLPASGSITYYETTQFIEGVQTYAGQTVTLSFWAKASSAVTLTSLFTQNFGSGGSTNVDTGGSTHAVTTSWQRFTVTIAMPSIAGKTIGTSSYIGFYLYTTTGLTTSMTIDLWGMQLEAASTASNFQTATGTKQGELAACQRYYIKSYAQATAPATATNTVGAFSFAAVNSTATDNRANVRFPVNMRGTPTITVYSSSTGTSAKIYNENTTLDLGGAAQFIGESGFHGYVSSGVITGAGTVLIFHYVASAEL